METPLFIRRLSKQGTVILAAVLLFSYLGAEVRLIPRLTVLSPCYLEEDPMHPEIARRFEEAVRQKQREGELPCFFSHRGDSIDHVEHTWAAYDAAIEKGSGYIEQDLVISKDGTLYVSHDESARRITGTGRNYRDMTDEEIGRLRTANGEHIHSLQDVFERYGHSVHYVVEVRPHEDEVLKFIEIVKQDGMEDNIIVQCMDLKFISQIHRVFPDMPVLFLAADLNAAAAGLRNDDVDIICLNRKWMSPRMAEWIHSYKKLYSVWTLDTEAQIKTAQSCGVDIFFTDDTALAAKMTGRKTA